MTHLRQMKVRWLCRTLADMMQMLNDTLTQLQSNQENVFMNSFDLMASM